MVATYAHAVDERRLDELEAAFQTPQMQTVEIPQGTEVEPVRPIPPRPRSQSAIRPNPRADSPSRMDSIARRACEELGGAATPDGGVLVTAWKLLIHARPRRVDRLRDSLRRERMLCGHAAASGASPSVRPCSNAAAAPCWERPTCGRRSAPRSGPDQDSPLSVRAALEAVGLRGLKVFVSRFGGARGVATTAAPRSRRGKRKPLTS